MNAPVSEGISVKSLISLGARLLVAAAVPVSLVGCGGQWNDSAECDEQSSSEPATVDLAVTGEWAYSTAMRVTQDENGGIDVYWEPVYSLTNASDEAICLHDVTVDFAAQRDAYDSLLDLEAVGGSELVDLYSSTAELESQDPDVTMTPPFSVDSGETVFARFHQNYVLTIDGVEGLSKADNYMQVMGPLLDLPSLGGGAYQCVLERFGLDTTVTSSAGTLSHETTNSIMPAGCLLNIPERDG